MLYYKVEWAASRHAIMKKNPADFSLSSFDSWNLVVEQSLFFFFLCKKIKMVQKDFIRRWWAADDNTFFKRKKLVPSSFCFLLTGWSEFNNLIIFSCICRLVVCISFFYISSEKYSRVCLYYYTTTTHIKPITTTNISECSRSRGYCIPCCFCCCYYFYAGWDNNNNKKKPNQTEKKPVCVFWLF